MNIRKAHMTSGGLMLAVACVMYASGLRAGYIINITRQDSWMMGISGFVLALPIVLVCAALCNRFPGKDVVQINDIIYGAFLGKVVSALYLFYFITLAALNTRVLGNFIVGFLLPETPIEAIIILFLIGCMYAIRKGISNLIYLCSFLVILAVVSLVLNTIFVLKDIRLEYLKPMFRQEPMDYIQSTVSLAAVPLGEIFLFTMIVPLLTDGKKVTRPFVLGTAISSVGTMIVLMRDVVTLGPLVSIMTLPPFESVRYVSLSSFLARTESLYSVVLVLLLLFKVTMLLYVITLGINRLFKPNADKLYPNDKEWSYAVQHADQERTGPPILIILAALVYYYSLFVFISNSENLEWSNTAAPFVSLTFEFVLPAVSLLVAILRKKSLPREVGA